MATSSASLTPTPAIPAGTITAIDPETHLPVELAVWKDPVTGGLLAVDASFLEQVRDLIPSPFGAHHLDLGDEPAAAPALKRVIYTYEVLVKPDVPAERWGMEDIAYHTQQGAASGHFAGTTVVGVPADAVDDLCAEHGTDPSFFDC